MQKVAGSKPDPPLNQLCNKITVLTQNIAQTIEKNLSIKKIFTNFFFQLVWTMSAVQENFAGIDFDEIKEATALEFDEIKVLKLCFNLFDVKKQDFLGSDDLVIISLVKIFWLFHYYNDFKFLFWNNKKI